MQKEQEMTMRIFDANHILRLILQDNAEMAEQAENLLDMYEVYVPMRFWLRFAMC